MSNPNFENIDRWFFEYTEGNLTASQENQLMSFLELHPELMSELNIWESSKVKAPVNTSVNTAPLIKKAPVLLRPIPLAFVSFLALISIWLGYSVIPVSPLYVQTNIDAKIIETDEETEFLFAQRNQSQDQDDENDSQHHTTSENINNNFKKTNLSSSIVESTTFNSAINKSSSKSELKKNLTDKKQSDKPNFDEFYKTISKDLIIDEFAYNEELNAEVRTNDLEKITNYLTKRIDKGQGSTSIEKIAQNTTRKSGQNSSLAKQSSLKKSINKTLRKIKRMADYPLALQNTKTPYFHAPMMTGYKANFAMVGNAPGNRIQATSRSQWTDSENSQLLNTLSWDGYIYAIRGGLGVEVNYNNYKNNELNNYSAAITYSPKFSINKKVSFEPAINFKMGVINLNQESEIIGNSIEVNRNNVVPLFDEQEVANGSQLWYRDLGLGFMINTKSFYAGFNADNIGRHNNNYFSSDIHKEYKSDIYYTAIIGTEYAARTKELKLSGYGLYQKYGNLEEFWLGTNIRYEWLHLGVAANDELDWAGTLGTTFNRLNINYNVDYTQSRLLNKQILSHQLSVRVLLKPSRYAAKFLKL
ncbi:type IX secretion system membrane protein PorP/SprF [Brumimicrobium aurantiacum]|uniref:Type IX secretion system membrane protein PorP/SprF n=1 Tax=Brumimicrobium aurantiacum TaxID=1737063 RepID=A0A3E1F0N9_9FLAO|nr:type IX secretion system membrane protein PorP/SprF [Brumimicrobium aurantiacum]RFC55392.1 type IX secretion system membrane protein PorP/SprF [Brumimicrobium aurantiacum]